MRRTPARRTATAGSGSPRRPAREAQREEHQPDDPELVEGLGIQRVRVADDHGSASAGASYQRISNVPAPVPTTGWSSPARQATRIVSARPVPGHAEQSIVEIGTGGERRLEAIAKLVDGARRAAGGGNGDDDHRRRHPPRGRRTTPRRTRAATGIASGRPSAPPTRAPPSTTTSAARTHASAVPSRLAAAAERPPSSAPPAARRTTHRTIVAGASASERPENGDAARIERDRRSEPEEQGEPRSAREREVQRGDEDRNRRSGERAANDARRRACATTPTATIAPSADSSPKAFQYPTGSASRLALNGIVEASKSIRKQPRGEPVRRDERDADQRSGDDRGPVATPQDERDRQRDGDVDEHALDLAHRRRRADRPDGRQRDPRPRARRPAIANAIRSRPGHATRSRISRTVVGTRNASATQPHDCEKYAPSLALAAVTIAATAAATMASVAFSSSPALDPGSLLTL